MTAKDENLSWFARCSSSFVRGTEAVFYSTGRFIGRHPLLCILLSTLLVAGCGVGLIRFHQETRREKIWVPYGSQSVIDKIRKDKSFPSNQRIQRLLVEADNILDPAVLNHMVSIDKRIKNITLEGGDNWYSLCIRIGHECLSTSILELWSFDEDIIRNLSDTDIIQEVNEENLVSPVYYSHVDVKQFLGGKTKVEANNTKIIQQAKVATMTYFIKDQSSIDDESGKYTDSIGEQWEQAFLDVTEVSSTNNISVYRFTSKSYTAESSNAIASDFTFLASGYFLLILYVMAATSKFTMVEHKVYIALAGITTIFVILSSLVLLGVCIWSSTSWEQDFDLRTMILSDSYLKAYLDKMEQYFPTEGAPTVFYLEHVDYYYERNALNQFYRDIHDNQYIQESSIKCWYIDFQRWMQSDDTRKDNSSDSDTEYWPPDDAAFFAQLAEFLDQSGQRYVTDILFDNSTGHPLNILASRFVQTNHIILRDVNEEITAMRSAREIATNAGFVYPNAAFVFSVQYFFSEANDVDIAGTLNFMGLTIDTIVSIPLILSIGLAVDYSVHVAHDFMVQKGSRNDRVKTTLVNMGPAVVNGGLSTLLAFILLALSKSYVFTTFFKIFLLVVVYGLFHGLAVLPALLSLIGPASYQPNSCDDNKGYLHLSLQNNSKPFYREKRCNSF
ncbi:uncharacterized protein [Amphiura filiformis]|uniref:uncharacterized protein n=1 Tax=Amphiura filiformis TaxID=82378 RepID=UPI003B2221D0